MVSRRYFATVPDRHGDIWVRTSQRPRVTFTHAAVMHVPPDGDRPGYSVAAFGISREAAEAAFRPHLIPGAVLDILDVEERDRPTPSYRGRALRR